VVETRSSDASGVLYYVGEDADLEKFSGGLAKTVTPWQLERAFKRERELSLLAASTGPIWVARPKRTRESELHRDGGILRASPYAKARDLMGAVFSHVEGHELKTLALRFEAATDEEVLGALVGL